MFNSKKNAKQALNGRKYNTTVYSGIRLTGEIKFSGDVYFDGRMKGNINAGPHKGSADILVIGPNATVAGNISAKEIYVLGKIEGNVFSEGIVFLLPGSLVEGDIHYTTIEMSHGAKINGRFHHLSGKGDKGDKDRPGNAEAEDAQATDKKRI